MGRGALAVGIGVVALAAPSVAPARSHFEPCVRSGRPIPFTTYWLGPTFEGLPVTHRSYSCSGGTIEPWRTNSASYVYGDCQPDPTQDDSSCAPPFEVQTQPACDHNLSDYMLGGAFSIGAHRLSLRGVPAISVIGDPRIELYTGDVSVVVFADTHAQARRAVAALQRAPAFRAGAAAGRLPAPVRGHLTGELNCGLRVARAAATIGGAGRDGARRIHLRLRLSRPGYAFVGTRGLSGQFWDGGFAVLGHSMRRQRLVDDEIELKPGRWELVLRAIDRVGHAAVRRLRLRVPPA
jgi:hypothetical protein